MPDLGRLIRVVSAPPLAVVRRLPGGATVAGLVEAVLGGEPARERPGERAEEPPASGVRAPVPQGDPVAAAEAALERERDPVEQSAFGSVDEPFAEGHVERDLELVAESAEREAAEPPGAELHVDEPWEGYRRMKVAEITARLEGQPAAVLAAVELYEATHRRRRGVLEATSRG